MALRSALPSFLLVAIGLLGCDSQSILSVQVRSDLVPGIEVDRFAAEITPASGGPVAGTVSRDVEVGAELIEATFPVGEATLPPDSYLVTAVAWRGGNRVAEGFVIVPVRNDRAVIVTVERSCAGRCSEPDDPRVCRHGECVLPDCEETGTCEEGCASDADCPRPDASCAEARCVEGTCLSAPRLDGCPQPDFYCHPERGCLPVPGGDLDAGVDAGSTDPDAGPDDAGPDDAGPPDAGSPDAGPTCEPPGMDCDGDGECDDVYSDPENCGSCGRSCGADACCAERCVDLAFDHDNCGACGARCGTGETCENGRCVCGVMRGGVGEGQRCPGGFLGHCCSGVCVDVYGNPDHCGACDVTCGYGETCSGTRCACGSTRGSSGGGPVCSGACCGGECSCALCC